MNHCMGNGSLCQKRASCSFYLNWRNVEDRKTVNVVQTGKECVKSGYKDFKSSK